MRPIIKSLNKEQNDRTRLDNDLLIKYFSKVACFQDINMTTGDLLKVIQSMSTIYVPQGEVLFRVGEKGYTFYIQLAGQSQLYLPNRERKSLKTGLDQSREKLEETERKMANVEQNKTMTALQITMQKMELQHVVNFLTK